MTLSTAAKVESLHESIKSREQQVEIVFEEEDPDLIFRERALVRKLDRRIMPMLTVLYICQRLDLSNIGNAKVEGLLTDLNMSDGDFSWVISIYTLGVMAMQVPSNMLMERSRPSLFLSLIVIIWSIVSIMTCFVKDFKTLAVARFFLGKKQDNDRTFTKSSHCFGQDRSTLFPSEFLLSTFYKPREIAVRNAIFYCGNWLSGALGGAFAGAIITGMEGVGGMRGWRWLFVLEGIITLLIGIASYWILPDYPSNTMWLTEDERDLAIRRLGHAAPKEKFSWEGVKAAILEYKVWVFIIIFMAIQTGGQMNYFMPTFIKNVGYDGAMVQYMTIPVYVFAAALSLIIAVLSDRLQVRSFFVAFCMCVALVGYVIQVTSENHALLFFSLFLCGGGVWSSLGVSLAWLGDCVPGPRQKKAVAFALLNCISQLANFYAPQLYNDPPRYLKANIVILTYMGLGVILCFGLRLLLARANRSLDAKYGKPLVTKTTVIPGGNTSDVEIAPETGVSKHFRYLL
ncbi:major facilitator superfamily domain-containing protein [Halteromyces radiatus]|uniref:major facilitator superfamily domain-containing protein n=1 Tax=Halteromyces radiatus TaxID=101107 RepID=UPI00222045B4|nr:major facilitator superfamily domain-containing protein [Halteromyces radiatus]KAI8089661.1 major facilitator superfamily domain-containing protein [Halteromyces radiatus]